MQYQGKRLDAYRLGQSAIAFEDWNFLPEALIFLLRGSGSGTSYHKPPDDAVDLLHKFIASSKGFI